MVLVTGRSSGGPDPPTQWTSQHPDDGEDHYTKVDDPPASPDDDDTYIRTSDSDDDFEYEFYTFDITLPEDAIIDSVTLYARGRSEDGDHKGTFCLMQKCPHEYKQWKGTFPEETYTTYSETKTTNPCTAAAWTRDDVLNLKAGVLGITKEWMSMENAHFEYAPVRCTQVYIAVEYHLPAVKEPVGDGLTFAI